ncbi:MAG: SMC-Scp complex subunit ScpB [Ignavibacteriaceae bacterium]
MDQIYNSIIEALIFSSDEPLRAAEIIKAIQGIDGEDISISTDDIRNCIDEINKSFEQSSRPYNIIEVANGYIFATKKEYAKYIGYLSSEKSKRRLSQAALETLAIIAYKQPLTKPEVETIRGVNSDHIINSLLEKNLITISGRADTIGRPLLYKTTDEFLKYFGLKSLDDLPKPREIDSIMNDEDFIEQKRKILMNALEEEAEKDSAKSEDDESQIE